MGNLKTLKENRAVTYQGDYLEAIARFKEPFDIVFLDPPYAMKESYQKAIDALLQKELLKPQCVIVVEYEGELQLNHEAFAERRDYTYGKSKVILLKR